MNPATIVNAIASGVLTAGVSAFMIMLYRSEGVVKRWPLVGSLFLRISLSATAAGSLFNCLTLSTPPTSEIVHNVGMAGIFCWAVYFHAKLIKNGSDNHKHRTRDDQGGHRQDHRSEGPNP